MVKTEATPHHQGAATMSVVLQNGSVEEALSRTSPDANSAVVEG